MILNIAVSFAIATAIFMLIGLFEEENGVCNKAAVICAAAALFFLIFQ